MKFGTISRNGRDAVVVAVESDAVAVLEDIMDDAPRSVMDVIAGGDALLGRVRAAVAGRKGAAVDSQHWLPPVPRPGKIMCVALNNSANKDRIKSGPKHPAMFIKASSSLIGHGQPIRLRADFGRVHPEPELAVVIGKGGSDIPVEQAMDHVFGYSIINDLTSPTMRGEDTFHYRAIHPKEGDASAIEYVDSWVSYPARYKCSDTFGPMGPWVVTRDAIDDPHDLTVRCVHQDELVTEDNTANLFFKVRDVVAFASTYMTLEPGDIISMGTALKAAGAANGKAVQNIDLNKLGGPIEVGISGIGRLINPVEWR
ncbi:MAG TPA: fumarylacetoacetate hydrolase family protein [Eoetvoesiella sp.]|uniref:fumarylacetoacetate hydrolase family protein n=1 Tax=Eoetvoesiella sp. TaxID=1966355 RepID=UPI002C366D1B|nr:fumarylacetoacetate hydrolase family protein [Eoetvoesiella sp.]HWK59816.1 fumarylacetoacetate hydrolase family protein [Eoetvoesiella sp.]